MESQQIDFEKQNGLVPVIIQDSKTMRVLMLGFMNQEAFEKTQKEQKVTFFSRTKNPQKALALSCQIWEPVF